MLVRMKRYLGLSAAWLVATALSVIIASAAVAGIRDRVVDTPVAIGAPTTSTTLAPAGTTTTTVPEVPATVPPGPDAPSVTDQPSATTTTAAAESPPVTTTTTVPQTTTTIALTYQTYTLVGGTVTLSFGNGEVRVSSVAPNAGFDADIEKGGPNEVEVDFESNDHKSELSAKIDNGELKVETEEESRDGDDD